jgi:streptogramin lyase
MRRLPILAPTLVLAALLVPAGASAAPKLAGTFDLSGQPGEIARGPDGNMWAVIKGSSDNKNLARIKPNGNVAEYAPAALVNPVGITAGPGDDNLWLTRNGGVVRVPPGDPDSAQDFAIAAIGDARGITSGPQKKLWAASGDQLVSFKPANPAGFDARTITGMNARGIATSGGKLWIADFGGKRILRVDPTGGVKKFKVGGGPQDVAKGPNGGAAYTNQGTDPHTVGRILGGEVKKTKVPNTDPFGIDRASDGKWWIANFASHNLSILSPNGNLTKFKKLPNNSGPRYPAAGKKGVLWVGLETAEKVARITGL